MMFIKPKNCKKRLQITAHQIINMLYKQMYIDANTVTLLRSQLNDDPVKVLQQLAEILKEQRIETIRDNENFSTLDITAKNKEI